MLARDAVGGRDHERAVPASARASPAGPSTTASPCWTNQAHLDPRVAVVPGHAERARGADHRPADRARRAQGRAQHLPHRRGRASSTSDEFELAKRFGDAAALALDNAQIRARLEHLAQTDSLTGLYNHRYFHERLRAELHAREPRARLGRAC